MSAAPVDRRALLGGIAATALGTGLPRPAAARPDAEETLAAIIAELAELPGGRSFAKACAGVAPDPVDVGGLISELAQKARAAGLGNAGPDTVRSWLAAQVRADFAAGRTIDVEGWRMARTEVRLAAAGAASVALA